MLNGLPLIDLHRHLDGSVRLSTIIDIAKQHKIKLPAWTESSLRPYVQIMEKQPGVMAFIEKFKYMIAIMVDEESCYRIAYEAVEDLKKESIDYAELRFSPWFMADANKIDAGVIVKAVVAGTKDASKALNIPVGLIGIISRTYGPELAWKELEALETCKEDIIALDLAGDEYNFPGEWYVPHFKCARSNGWQVTVHAGEASGPESIWQAIDELGASRIGHGVSAFQDPKLIEYMRDHQIGVESNLTSNVQTSTVADYALHPLKRFLEENIQATINTDDPGISAITLLDEYKFAVNQVGLSHQQVEQAQRNAIQQAFLSESKKIQLNDTKT
ncbi:MAG: adenosine deaminase [Anaerolineaceae bacterium]|nr:adenosine deaminase [Anaerolineaceae bacterium]